VAIHTERINQLEDLVATPAERESQDLKSWIDLNDQAARADIAKHLAAIANYGGGYLIFGFNDDNTRCARKDDVRDAYSHDVFAAIIDKYLQPKFQCDVSFVEFEGVEHAVVWIPSNGMTPVISRASGPHDAKGKPQGISQGTIYIRWPKPESVAISAPEQWEKIIQRCILARRDEMLSMFSAIMSGGAPAPKEEPDDSRERLAAWHSAAQRAAIREAGRAQAKFRYPLDENFVQMSYLIRHKNGEQIPAGEMLRVADKLNTAVSDTVRYGWSAFYPFTREPIAPRFLTDRAVDGGDSEFLQTSLYEGANTDHMDFWRMSLDGRASILRTYHEDRRAIPHVVPTGAKWFDPWLHARDITELVRHAWAFSEEFTDVSEICFQLEWKGLTARMIAAYVNSGRSYSESYTARGDWRNLYDHFPQAAVIGDLPGVVARLFAPLYRMFNTRSGVDGKWVARQMRGFIEL
jgi:hypothetical protein